ncbi:MAG TPA: glucose-6-phosphate dehydrogenase, partial [Caldithrix sp.]|nr:glucose-6-phosphate dehydrogenase [Caldithrix sp.]
MKKPVSFIFVVFGGSGDLAKRKLLPALFHLFKNDLLPENFAILGLGRKPYDDISYRQKMADSIKDITPKIRTDDQSIRNFIKRIFYSYFDMNDDLSYKELKTNIQKLNADIKTSQNILFYLATPPEFFKMVASGLQAEKLNLEPSNSWKRIIVEKPFGHNLSSAHELNTHLQKIFNEDQIFRIDHYLGKETVQNIMAFRFANGIFEPLWNRNYISHVEITSAESIGVEDRGGYYDTSGALRDMVQNHLLQLAATIAMEPPSTFEAKAVRDEKYKFFQALRKIESKQINKQVIRGQYIESMIRGKKVAGYRDEINVNPESQTETFVALKFFVDNWRWADVPFFIRTGKRLPTRVTEMVIHFKKTPYHLFKAYNKNHLAENQLILRIQPNEGILLKFGMKTPGAGFKVQTVNMDFHYSDLAHKKVPAAYERLLLDCMQGDATLYSRGDAVEAAWEFVQPIINAWETNP